MFGFFNMTENYEERLIANDKIHDTEVDTVAVSDSDQPYETAIADPHYNKGKWVIVEMYDTKEEAKQGHNKWLNEVTNGSPPNELVDVSSCDIVKLGGLEGTVYKRDA